MGSIIKTIKKYESWLLILTSSYLYPKVEDICNQSLLYKIMVVFHRIFFVLIIALFVSISYQNCSDSNCKNCSSTNPALCDLCNTNYILVNSTCLPCNSVFTNCNICNDTVLPLQCVSCSKGFYSNADFSTCDTCGNLIANCAQC